MRAANEMPENSAAVPQARSALAQSRIETARDIGVQFTFKSSHNTHYNL